MGVEYAYRLILTYHHQMSLSCFHEYISIPLTDPSDLVYSINIVVSSVPTIRYWAAERPLHGTGQIPVASVCSSCQDSDWDAISHRPGPLQTCQTTDSSVHTPSTHHVRPGRCCGQAAAGRARRRVELAQVGRVVQEAVALVLAVGEVRVVLQAAVQAAAAAAVAGRTGRLTRHARLPGGGGRLTPAGRHFKPPRQSPLRLGRHCDGAELLVERVASVGALDDDGGAARPPAAVPPLQTGHLTLGQVMAQLVPGGSRGGSGQARSSRPGQVR